MSFYRMFETEIYFKILVVRDDT